ncbi:MAG: zf-HC2 domain-containing protein [Marmoricola sp.]
MTGPARPEERDSCGSAAAYVLGALPGEDRRAFEVHLADCADCRRVTAELAGLPGLLARVSPADLVESGPGMASEAVPVPETVLPRLLREVRRRSRTRRLALAGAAAAAVAAVVGAGVVGLVAGDGSGAPTGTAMTRLVSAPISASVALRPETHGTRVDMRCRYDGGGYAGLPGYHLVVTGTDGSTHDVAQWRVGPDGSTRVVASVDLPRERIASIDVRTAGGLPVLRLRP